MAPNIIFVGNFMLYINGPMDFYPINDRLDSIQRQSMLSQARKSKTP